MTIRVARWFLILACVVFSSAAAFADDDREDKQRKSKHFRLDRADKAGEIRGVFERCGPNGSAGVFVHIIGRSFSALLPSDGKFTLSYVPRGTYSLAFVQSGNVLTTLDGVEVRKRKLTDLGTLSFCPDADDDGFDESVDCNDNNPTVFPGASEACDGLDNDCNGAADDPPGGCVECTDADNDGFFAQELCGVPVDCDDTNPTINPNADEVCDGWDNNCDGVVDEGFDADQDGITTCGGDCNDGDPNIFPGAEEVCGDQLDSNCDGDPDDGNVCGPTCQPGTACEAADLCSIGTCDATGECVQTPIVCTPQDACHQSSCDPSTGECIQTPKVCEASSSCSQAFCEPVTGECVEVVLDDTAVCENGGTCQSGVCVPPSCPNNCSNHGECLGEGICECFQGWTGVDCGVDINECTPSPCSPNAVCINTLGGFLCECLAGYEGDGLTCVDIDECAVGPCSPNESCVNTQGGFLCVPSS